MIDVTGKRGVSLGCGMVYQGPDIIHVDIRETPVVDVVMDLDRFPWAFPSAWAEVVYALDILEHLDDAIHAMEEIWRLLKPQGEVYLRLPNHAHPQAFRAMDHKRFGHPDNFDLMIRGTEYFKGYSFYSPVRFRKLAFAPMGAELTWTLAKDVLDDGTWTLP